MSARPGLPFEIEPCNEVDDAQRAPLRQLAQLAPRPLSPERLGLSVGFLGDLLLKHLASAGVLSTSQLLARLAIAGPVLDRVLALARAEARIEVRARLGQETELRYGLSEKGRSAAAEAFARGGYVGPAPVPLEQYAVMVASQSVHAHRVTRQEVLSAFADMVIDERLLDRFGPALNSRRAILLYGHAGTGKTYTARRLAAVIEGVVLIPHAILVHDAVLELYDPLAHDRIDFAYSPPPASLDEGFDPRYVACERPIVATGGELDAGMLEVRMHQATRRYVAPIQLKANNGFLLIDDLGRQRIDPATLLNRWIVPMESHQDALTLGSGQHFQVPFDVVLVFSTNLTPGDIADDAFLRRLGYKIEFKAVTPEQYRQIWMDVCTERGLHRDDALADWAIERLHRPSGMPLLPCHPRDLLGMAHDRARYLGQDDIDMDAIRWAWEGYFVSSGGPPARDTPGSAARPGPGRHAT